MKRKQRPQIDFIERISESERFGNLVQMKMNYENIGKRIVIVLCLSAVLCLSGVSSESALGDPYRVLGVDRKATNQEIKKAYRKLVKEWFVESLQTS